MKFVKFALVVAMALCLTASVYAETQSVKVSGDLAVRGIFRGDYDYRGTSPHATGAAGDARDGFPANADAGAAVAGPNTSWWMSTTEVQIDADLTDNVSTSIRLANERDWNVNTKSWVNGQNMAMNGSSFTGGGYTGNIDDFQVGLDLAYVKLKNFIYSPLTVTIGRQDLWFGKGFIVGSNQVYNNYRDGNLTAPEYTAYTAFDSIKAVLDYDPWTIAAVYSKIGENAIADFDDIDLYGVNVGYKFDNYKAEAEAYWFWKQDRSIEQWGDTKASGNNDIHTLGIRGSMDPITDVTLAGEVAYQLGSIVLATGQNQVNTRSAWALDVSGEYRGFMEKFAWKPKIGAEYIFYSGEQTNTNDNTATGVYHGWDPMFRGKYDSAIREFVGTYYTSYDYRTFNTGYPSAPDASFTNQNQMVFSGSLQPMESVLIKGNANMFWLNEGILAQNPGIRQGVGNDIVKGYIGTEFDVQAIWDYTEDVSFGLLAAWFVPGSEVYQNADKTASDIVGTCKVSF